jgi:alpha-tubulin suppressor-like RCC1 family protein
MLVLNKRRENIHMKNRFGFYGCALAAALAVGCGNPQKAGTVSSTPFDRTDFWVNSMTVGSTYVDTATYTGSIGENGVIDSISYGGVYHSCSMRVSADGIMSGGASFYSFTSGGSIAVQGTLSFKPNGCYSGAGTLSVSPPDTDKGRWELFEFDQSVYNKFVSVNSYYHHSFAVTSDGKLYGCGFNTPVIGASGYSYLGTGDEGDRLFWTPVLDNVAQVSASGYYSMALKKDGSVWITGNRETDPGIGKLLHWTMTFPSGAKSVEAGYDHAYIINNDGVLYTTGLDSTGMPRDGWFPFMSGVAKASGGWNETMNFVVKTDGSLLVNTGNSSWSKSLDGVQDVDAGFYHHIALKTDKSVWVMGENSAGQLGLGDVTSRTEWTKTFDNGVKVAVGDNFSVVLDDKGSLYWAGPPLVMDNSWKKVADDVKDVTAGYKHVLIIKKDNTVWGIGINDNGQIGAGHIYSASLFTRGIIQP